MFHRFATSVTAMYCRFRLSKNEFRKCRDAKPQSSVVTKTIRVQQMSAKAVSKAFVFAGGEPRSFHQLSQTTRHTAVVNKIYIKKVKKTSVDVIRTPYAYACTNQLPQHVGRQKH